MAFVNQVQLIRRRSRNPFFGFSGLKNTLDKKSTCLGSPCWMAPELIISGRTDTDGVTTYDNRIDVWALGEFENFSR